MCICLGTAAFCIAAAVMNSSFAVAVEHSTSYETSARYWLFGALGFVLLASACGLRANLLRRKRQEVLNERPGTSLTD